MLDEFKEEQPVCFKILENAVKNKTYSHAYLFETNGYTESLPLVISFVKNIFSTEDSEINKIIYDKIDKNIFSELEIINPDGLWIKKDQLDELQQKFLTKPLESNKKVYIINEAEKLNTSSANSILKFLEEPEDDIIAILITDNIYKMLKTIISRCQVISLNKSLKEINNTSLEHLKNIIVKDSDKNILFECEDDFKEKINKIIKFIIFFETKKLDSILYTEKLWHKNIKNKVEYIFAFDIIIMFYKDIFNYKIKNKIEYFNENKEDIIKIAEINEIDTLSNKINKILELKELIKNNINLNLLIDKLIIELEDINHG